MPNPLVSCMMPTYNRRGFIPRAIKCFQTQDYYSNLELIILDDGTDPIKDLLPNDLRIKYFQESPKKNHGEKMNRCFELAQGEFGIVWDDDDWYSADRISRQIQPMIDNPALLLTGSSTIYYYEEATRRAWCYASPSYVGWLASIAIRKTAWEAQRFENTPAGADYTFQRKLLPGAKFDLRDPALVVAAVHPANACRKALGNEYRPVSWAMIEGLLDENSNRSH